MGWYMFNFIILYSPSFYKISKKIIVNYVGNVKAEYILFFFF